MKIKKKKKKKKKKNQKTKAKKAARKAKGESNTYLSSGVVRTMGDSDVYSPPATASN